MSFEGFRITNGKVPKRKLAAAQFESDEDEQSQQLGAQPPLSSSRDNAGLEKEAGDRAAAAGHWGLALRHWDSALAAGAADAHVLHEAKAQVLLEVGDDWRALQCASRAVELQSGWAAGHLTLARAQLNLGEPELALASMEQVLQLQPGHTEAEEEIGAVRAMVVRRQRSGSAAAGQRARVVGPGGAAEERAAGTGGGGLPLAEP
ncbi:hypothetical protein ABPG77_010582 [Micractinium sp. CCAP 211/92]